LIAQVEMDGVWSIEGGMHALPRCLERMAKERGVMFMYGQPCKSIDTQGGKVSGVSLGEGGYLPADAVVFNGDVSALHAGLLGADVAKPTAQANRERSLSAITWSMVAKTNGMPLERHNVFFSKHLRR